jgi:crotonobetainyl-CoA:carnitine CoA-transferase CaiB-like acyl-CoA transferase
MSSGEALKGVKVLDLSRILAAPFAAQMLGDLGADVIKVERPGAGDDSRSYGPPFLDDADGNPTDDAAFYLACNRNKRSIAVDHATKAGRAVIVALAKQSDILIENFRPGVLAKYNLDYASLSALNPRLIYCSITGFGQDGPYSTRPGYDGVFQAMSGLMSVSGLPDGVPGGGPMKVGVSMIDILAGLYAGNAILAALHQRDQITGKGAHIDMALLDCGVAALSHYAQNYLVSGKIPDRRGNGGFGGIPSQSFACADGDIFIVASTIKQFRALADVVGMPELADDRRFSSVQARIADRDALLTILDGVLATRPVTYWLEALEAADVPVSPVNNVAAVFDNPQVKHRGLLQSVAHPVAGQVNLLRSPIRMGNGDNGLPSPPPGVGEHTDDVLQELGYPAEQIGMMRADGAIG